MHWSFTAAVVSFIIGIVCALTQLFYPAALAGHLGCIFLGIMIGKDL